MRGIILECLEIETDGEIDLRGFLGIDPTVRPGYEILSYVVRIKGSGTKEQFAEIHEAVMATSPNFYNVSQPVTLQTDSRRRVIAGSDQRGAANMQLLQLLASRSISLGSLSLIP